MSTRVIYSAQSEFEALAVQNFLRDEGIDTVVQSNEMPQEPGFRFGSGPWGYLYSRDDQAEAAIELAREYADAMLGSEAERMRMPMQLNLRPSWIASGLLLLFLALLLLFQIAAQVDGAGSSQLFEIMVATLYGVAIALNIAMLACASSHMGRAMFNALKVLPMLLLAPLALLWLLLDYLRQLPVLPQEQSPGV